jgi:hypothetical protein
MLAAGFSRKQFRVNTPCYTKKAERMQYGDYMDTQIFIRSFHCPIEEQIGRMRAMREQGLSLLVAIRSEKITLIVPYSDGKGTYQEVILDQKVEV